MQVFTDFVVWHYDLTGYATNQCELNQVFTALGAAFGHALGTQLSRADTPSRRAIWNQLNEQFDRELARTLLKKFRVLFEEIKDKALKKKLLAVSLHHARAAKLGAYTNKQMDVFLSCLDGHLPIKASDYFAWRTQPDEQTRKQRKLLQDEIKLLFQQWKKSWCPRQHKACIRIVNRRAASRLWSWSNRYVKERAHVFQFRILMDCIHKKVMLKPITGKDRWQRLQLGVDYCWGKHSSILLPDAICACKGKIASAGHFQPRYMTGYWDEKGHWQQSSNPPPFIPTYKRSRWIPHRGCLTMKFADVPMPGSSGKTIDYSLCVTPKSSRQDSSGEDLERRTSDDCAPGQSCPDERKTEQERKDICLPGSACFRW